MEKIKAKVEQVLHKDKDESSHNTQTGNTHSDSSHNTHSTGGAGGLSQGTSQHEGYGNTHSTGGTYGSDPSGPHDTRTANQLDPRVSLSFFAI